VIATASTLLVLAQGAATAYVGPAGASVEQGRAEIRAFKTTHVSGDLAAAEAMLVADPAFRIEQDDYTLPKREFLEWMLQCKVSANEELPPPPSIEGVNQVVEVIWFDCPRHPLTSEPKSRSGEALDRYQVRTSFVSGGRGIEMR
jgi:hypothetical protein